MNLDNLSLEELQELETRRKRENPLAFYTPHDKQIEFHNQTNPIRIFLAGNRLGKTTGGAIEAIWYALGKHPTKKIPTPNEGWVVSVDFAASRDVAQKKILEYLPRKHLKKFHAVDQILELSNGSLISFKSGDSGTDKFSGAKKQWIWFDEEPPYPVYMESSMRTVSSWPDGTSGHIWLTMTPLKGLTFVWTMVTTPNDSVGVVRASMYDNPHISHSEIKRFEASMSETEKEARIRGNFVMLGGRPVFDTNKLQNRLKIVEQGLSVRINENPPGIIDDPYYGLRVWKKPAIGHEYIIGADVSEGLETGDFSVAQVLDRITKEQVAVYRAKIEPDKLAFELGKLGRYYNNAMIAVESNNHGLTTITALMKFYYNLYRRMRIGEVNGKMALDKIGWRTDMKTRPLSLDTLGKYIRNEHLTLNDEATINELITFIYPEADLSHPEAQYGCHDDCVMALAIALSVHEQLGACTFRIPEADKHRFSLEQQIWIESLGMVDKKPEAGLNYDEHLGYDW